MLTLLVPYKELPERWPCDHWPPLRLSRQGCRIKAQTPRPLGGEPGIHVLQPLTWGFRYARKPVKHSTQMCHIHSCEFTKPLATALQTPFCSMPAHSSPERNRNVERRKGRREKGSNEGRQEGKEEACSKLGSVCFRPAQVKPSPAPLPWMQQQAPHNYGGSRLDDPPREAPSAQGKHWQQPAPGSSREVECSYT